jgi:FkbM family methyltransferase
LSVRTSLIERLPDTVIEPMRNLRIGRIRRQMNRRGYVTNRIGVRLFVDRQDPRALWLARNRGVTSSPVVRLWGDLVDELAPAIVLDVGANYGEVTFSTTYPAHTAIHLVEANPELVRLLQRTINESSLAPTMSLHGCAASHEVGTVTLHITGDSSGFSSIVPDFEADRAITVPARTIDSLVESKPGSSLLFKIDVEGYELSVLRGMERLLRDHLYAGIVEAWPGSESELVARHEVYLVERGSLAVRPVNARELGFHLRDPAPGFMGDVLVRSQRS